jgi:hypothetical protein
MRCASAAMWHFDKTAREPPRVQTYVLSSRRLSGRAFGVSRGVAWGGRWGGPARNPWEGIIFSKGSEGHLGGPCGWIARGGRKGSAWWVSLGGREASENQGALQVRGGLQRPRSRSWCSVARTSWQPQFANIKDTGMNVTHKCNNQRSQTMFVAETLCNVACAHGTHTCVKK